MFRPALFSILTLICWMQSHAKTHDMNQAVLLVHEKTSELPDKATQLAFNQVLSKRSGTIITPEDWIHTNPNIEAIIERYDYTKITCMQEEEDSCYHLNIHFNPENIHKYMSENGLSPWNSKRPNTLIWINKIDPETNLLQPFNSYDTIASEIQEQAQQRNMTIIFPSGDITDQQVVGDDLPNNVVDYLKNKYHVQQILHGATTQDGTQEFKWEIITSEQRHEWKSQSTNLSTALTKAIDHIVNLDKLKNTDPVQTEEISTVIEVKQLSNIDDFSALSSHLTQYETIKGMSIESIGPDFIAIEVKHTGSLDSLLSILQNDTQLQSSIDSPNSAKAKACYQWIHSNQQPISP